MAKRVKSRGNGSRTGFEGDGLDPDEMVDHLESEFGMEKPPEPVDEKAQELAEAKEVEPDPEPAPEPTEPIEEVAPEPATELEAASEPLPTVETPGDTPAVVEPVEETPAPVVPVVDEAERQRAGMVADMQKLRDRNALLEQELMSQAAPQAASQAPPSVPASAYPQPPAITFDDEGNARMPDFNDPANREWLRAQVGPTPLEQQQMQAVEQQQDFETRKAAFVKEDSRRQPIAERIEQARNLVDMRSKQVMQATGERPNGPEQEAAFLERHGIGAEFRQYVPELSPEEMPLFVDAMFHGSNIAKEHYMREFSNRVLPPLSQPGATVPTTAQPLPSDIPPRLAAQGTPNLEREGKPGKMEQLEDLSQQKGADPFGFTVEKNAELTKLQAELGFQAQQ